MTRTRHRTESVPVARGQRARVVRLMLLVAFVAACAAVIRKPNSVTAADAAETETYPFAHGVRVYVSGVNCEMNAEDATRINALSLIRGLAVEVVFTGIANSDTSALQQARRDLGLIVPARIMTAGELAQYKSVGGRLPMALVIKGRQLKTVVAGEGMPRTLSMLEASFSPGAVP